VGDQATTAVELARDLAILKMQQSAGNDSMEQWQEIWQFIKCNNQPVVTAWSNSSISYVSTGNTGSL